MNSKIDKTQQNSKSKLCGKREETINYKISECSKLAQTEYKTRHDWVGKVINWELCKKFKFEYEKMVYAQPRIRPWKWNAQTSLKFFWYN